MSSHYCVVQFVPDPVADERVNIGVLAFDEHRVRSAFLEDWRRAVALSGASVTPVRRVIRDIERATSDDVGQGLLSSPGQFHRLTAELIDRLAENWSHSLQLTPPRGSLADVDTLLAQTSQIMLKQGPVRRRSQSKLRLVRSARLELEQAIAKVDALRSSGRVVETRIEISGRFAKHEVDIAVRNGGPRVAAQAVSFSRVTSQQVQKDVNATAWVLDDIRQAKDHPRLAVLVSEPGEETRREYDEAVELFTELADDGVVRPGELGAWAEQAVQLALA